MKKVILLGKVDEFGRVSVDLRNAENCGRIKRADLACREVEITVSRRVRRLRHNKYYFGLLVKPIAKHLSDYNGCDVTLDEAHDFLKGRFGKLRTRPDLITGEAILDGYTTRTMTTDEFGQYCLKVEQFGVNIGIDWGQIDRERLRQEHEQFTIKD